MLVLSEPLCAALTIGSGFFGLIGGIVIARHQGLRGSFAAAGLLFGFTVAPLLFLAWNGFAVCVNQLLPSPPSPPPMTNLFNVNAVMVTFAAAYALVFLFLDTLDSIGRYKK